MAVHPEPSLVPSTSSSKVNQVKTAENRVLRSQFSPSAASVLGTTGPAELDPRAEAVGDEIREKPVILSAWGKQHHLQSLL